MKRLILVILILSLAVMGLSSPAQAEIATMDDARTVANNWITLIIEQKGDWGGSEIAEVEEIQEFKRGKRVIGYFCHVKPKGYIVVSLHKELAPVKAYSATCDLDPASNEGMADLIKGGMERILNRIEQRLGHLERVRTEELRNILEINYRRAWEEIERGDLEIKMNYQEGEVMLSSNWHQGPPYNEQCPYGNCSQSPNKKALVGCAATAGAQIMRYWNWPPYRGDPTDTFDWPNMPDEFTGCSWPPAQVDAVAELCFEVGVGMDMTYGCGASGADTSDLEDAYEDHFRYSEGSGIQDRDDYSSVGWFERIKASLNLNRPVQYNFRSGDGGHSIVGDGWQEIGSTPIRQYHMNYGWGRTGTFPNGNNTWYTIDALHGSNDPDEECMLENIYPAQALGSWLSGTYSLQSFPYRYFDQDATGTSATFGAGQNLQFLPDITVTCTSATGNSIRFEGSSSQNTRLFTRGDMTKGVRIYDGAVKLNRYGSVQFE